jgi:hypothetical protein
LEHEAFEGLRVEQAVEAIRALAFAQELVDRIGSLQAP